MCRKDIASGLIDSRTINLEGDIFTLDEILSLPLRFTPEFRRILRSERVPMTAQEHDTANSNRSWWVYQIYRYGTDYFPTEPEDAPQTNYEAFLEVYINHRFDPVYLSIQQEFYVYNWLIWQGFFDGVGFDIIRQVTGKSNVEIYGELMSAGVRMRLRSERWFVSDNDYYFFPLRFERSYRRNVFTNSQFVENWDSDSSEVSDSTVDPDDISGDFEMED